MPSSHLVFAEDDLVNCRNPWLYHKLWQDIPIVYSTDLNGNEAAFDFLMLAQNLLQAAMLNGVATATVRIDV